MGGGGAWRKRRHGSQRLALSGPPPTHPLAVSQACIAKRRPLRRARGREPIPPARVPLHRDHPPRPHAEAFQGLSPSEHSRVEPSAAASGRARRRREAAVPGGCHAPLRRLLAPEGTGRKRSGPRCAAAGGRGMGHWLRLPVSAWLGRRSVATWHRWAEARRGFFPPPAPFRAFPSITLRPLYAPRDPYPTQGCAGMTRTAVALSAATGG